MKPELCGAAETSLLTVFAKAAESRLPDSLLRDWQAREVVDRFDYDFARLSVDHDSIIAIAVRARMLDDWTRDFLAEHPSGVVLHLGSGLDSRVVRVDPPDTCDWYEVDFPDVMTLRRQVFRQRRKCHLIASSVLAHGWLKRIPRERPTLIIAEGLLPYLCDDQVQCLLERLTGHFAQGELAFDGYDRLSLALLQATPMIQATGASLNWSLDDPRELERRFPGLQLRQAAKRPAPDQLARLSLPGRIALFLRDSVPAFYSSSALLRYEFGSNGPPA